MGETAQLILRDDPGKVAQLHRSKPTTIGRAESNRLRLASLSGVADHHAVVRFSISQGWLVCDWQSRDGTFLEGQRVQQCRRLSDGDEIQLGSQGPVLVFRLVEAATGAAASPPVDASQDRSRSRSAQPGPSPGRRGGRSQGSSGAGSTLKIEGRSIALDQIRSAHVHSRQRYPNSFSWWVLLCLGGMVLLPFTGLFWGVEIAALAAWILLGSRKQHVLVITLRDGMAHRCVFANRITALSHRNGIRKAIGQSLDAG